MPTKKKKEKDYTYEKKAVKPLGEAEKYYIGQHLGTMTYAEMAKNLGLTYRQIDNYCFRLKKALATVAKPAEPESEPEPPARVSQTPSSECTVPSQPKDAHVPAGKMFGRNEKYGAVVMTEGASSAHEGENAGFQPKREDPPHVFRMRKKEGQ